MRTSWNYAKVEKDGGKSYTKQKILMSLAVCMVNYFCRMSYFQFLFDEKFDLFPNLFHFPAKMQTRTFRVS